MADTDADSPAPFPSCKEGPVLIMMTKRLRALKKKYNRIVQIEESKAQGKAINKEQEEVLKTKIAVAALIDEYEKLRQPLQVAVKEELAEREKELMAATLRRGEEEESVGGEKEAAEGNEGTVKEARELSGDEVRKDLDGDAAPAVCNSDHEDAGFELRDGEQEQEQTTDGFEALAASDMLVADLLQLLYFAQLFDIKSHREAPSLVWTKVHERSSCLSYDFVTEDSTSPLFEDDLDALALFGSLVTSRPPNATFSHRDALEQCIQHAILWLHNSDQPIRSDLGLTYSHLRERLYRILSSEYFAMNPELQTVSKEEAAAAASAAGQYTSQMVMLEASGGGTFKSESASVYLSHQDPMLFHREHYTSPPVTGSVSLEAPDGQLTTNTDAPFLSDTIRGDEIAQFGSQVDADHTSATTTPPVLEVHEERQSPLSTTSPQEEEPQQPQEQQQQQQEPHFSRVRVGPRGYQGPKGGGRGLGYGTGGRGRGYVNGHGRGARGGYTNGRNGQFFDQGGYYPRNYYGRGGGRGARAGDSMYNGHADGPTNVTM